MTIQEARDIVERAWDNANMTEAEEFELTEALSFLISETGDPRCMMYLGGIHYDNRDFDLALKYYEMADACGYGPAQECLGYVWYYGRTGEKDYKKAFEYFSKAAARGSIVASYKVADMYKNGYYVEKDYGKYCEIIEELYPLIRDTDWLNDPLPEISMRLARIRAEQGDKDEAVRLLLEARDFLAQRILSNPFFGDLNNMEWLIGDLYRLIDCDYTSLRFYDLYHVLKTPCTVRFRYDERVYEVESVEEEGGIAVRFEDKWFRTIRDFFARAEIGGKRLVTMPYQLYNLEVVR